MYAVDLLLAFPIKYMAGPPSRLPPAKPHGSQLGLPRMETCNERG